MKPVFFALALATLLAGCATTSRLSSTALEARSRMMEEIANEPPGNYFVARRYYKQDYKFWGYVRKPGEPWTTAQMVVLNENKKLAPDRESGSLGSDNGYEYRLYGYFSGEKVYEPASNGFYPEFVLTGYELKSSDPAPIFTDVTAALDPARRVLLKPY